MVFFKFIENGFFVTTAVSELMLNLTFEATFIIFFTYA